ncbi:MAG: fimbrillin family protein [Bacteroides sp.]|nr:fimbrillin family protein [Bacteroides sp.]
MKLKSLVAITAIMASLCSCSNEDFGDLPGGKRPQGEIIIKAKMPSPDDSRASATQQDDKFVFAWQEGDSISVLNKVGNSAKNNAFVLSPGTEGTTGEFTGSLTDEGPIVCAIYPYNANHKLYYSGGNLTGRVTLPEGYGSYEEDYNGNTNAPMYATPVENGDGSYDMSFKHLGAVIRLELKNVPPEAARVRLSTDKKINGSFSVYCDSISESHYIETPFSSYGGTSIKFRPAVDIPEGEANSNATRDMTFFFPLPTGEYESLNFDLTDKNGKWLIHEYVWSSDTRPFTLSRADVAMYPVITLVCTSEGLLQMDDETLAFNELINQNDSLKLDRDYVVKDIKIAKDFTLDCNGHKLKTSGIVIDSGNVTIKDSDTRTPYEKRNIEPNGEVNALIHVSKNGNLKLENLSMSVGNSYAEALVNNDGGRLDMNYCRLYGDVLLTLSSNSTTTVTDCTLEVRPNSNYEAVNCCDSYLEFRGTGRIPDRNLLAPVREFIISWVFVQEKSTVIFKGSNNVVCQKLSVNSYNSESINVEIHGGTFYEPDVLKYVVEKDEDGYMPTVYIKLNENHAISEPIRVERGNIFMNLAGYTITNTTDSNVNPATGEIDGNSYTCGLLVSNANLTLRDSSNGEGGISVNSTSGVDGIRRAIWTTNQGSLVIYDGQYFSSQTNKNSRCDVVYTDKLSGAMIIGGKFETDCYTGDGSNGETIYSVLNDDQKLAYIFSITGGEYVNFNPLKPGYGEAADDLMITMGNSHELKVYDDNGNDITVDYKDKTYHEANMALKKGNENARITYKVVFKPSTSN